MSTGTWRDIVPRNGSPALRQGKLDALAGRPLPARGSMKHLNMEQEHMYRMGYIVAKGQRERHPDWSDEFILW